MSPPSAVSATVGARRPLEKAMSAHHQVARALGIDILSGRLAEDALLPSEKDLLARFQVSRTVLREALKTLTAKGLIVSKPRVGTKVLPSSKWSYFDPDVLSWKVTLGYDEAFRDDLAEIRRAIEPRAAMLAARRCSAEDVATLRACIAQMKLKGLDRRGFADADLALHLGIVNASGNVLMRAIGGIIEAALVSSFTLSSPADEPDVLAESLRRHEAIIDAIEAGDAPAAAAAMLHVIDVGAARFKMSSERAASVQSEFECA